MGFLCGFLGFFWVGFLLPTILTCDHVWLPIQTEQYSSIGWLSLNCINQLKQKANQSLWKLCYWPWHWWRPWLWRPWVCHRWERAPRSCPPHPGSAPSHRSRRSPRLPARKDKLQISVMNPHWFQCGSGSSIFWTQNWKKFTAEIFFTFLIKNWNFLQEKSSSLKRDPVDQNECGTRRVRIYKVNTAF